MPLSREAKRRARLEFHRQLWNTSSENLRQQISTHVAQHGPHYASKVPAVCLERAAQHIGINKTVTTESVSIPLEGDVMITARCLNYPEAEFELHCRGHRIHAGTLDTLIQWFPCLFSSHVKLIPSDPEHTTPLFEICWRTFPDAVRQWVHRLPAVSSRIGDQMYVHTMLDITPQQPGELYRLRVSRAVCPPSGATLLNITPVYVLARNGPQRLGEIIPKKWLWTQPKSMGKDGTGCYYMRFEVSRVDKVSALLRRHGILLHHVSKHDKGLIVYDETSLPLQIELQTRRAYAQWNQKPETIAKVF